MIVYGKQIFLYLLKKHPHLINEVYLTKEIDKKIFSQLLKLKVNIKRVDNKKAQALAKGGNHQGYILDIKEFEFSDFDEIKKGDFVVVLAGITDVGNIGSIVRTAYALGVSGIVVSMINNINISSIARTSSGAVFDMPITIKKDILTVLNELKQKDFKIYCADMDGVDVRKATFFEKKVLVLGSEGDGLTSKVLKKCDEKVTIKMQRDFDSLNVSVAFGILCDRMRDGE